MIHRTYPNLLNITNIFYPMKNAKGYTRISTEDQLRGVSLEVQRNKIESYCERKNLSLTKIYVDVGVSGTTLDRPQLQGLLSQSIIGDIVIISDLSRLSRNEVNSRFLIEMMRKSEISLICLEPEMNLSETQITPEIDLLLKMNQLEVDRMSAKIKDSMLLLSKEGKLRSAPPFGWKFVAKDRDYEPVPAQQEVIEKIRTLYKEGFGFQPIARILNDTGYNVTLTLNKSIQNHEKAGPKIFYAMTIKRILEQNGDLAPSDGRSVKSISTRIKARSSADVPTPVVSKSKYEIISESVASKRQSDFNEKINALIRKEEEQIIKLEKVMSKQQSKLLLLSSVLK